MDMDMPMNVIWSPKNLAQKMLFGKWPEMAKKLAKLIFQHPAPQVPTSTAFYWPSTIINQPVPPSTDRVPSHINQYRLLLTQYHQV